MQGQGNGRSLNLTRSSRMCLGGHSWAIGLVLLLIGCTPQETTLPPTVPSPTSSPGVGFSPPPLPSVDPSISPSPGVTPISPSPTLTASPTAKSAEVKTVETKLAELVAQEGNLTVQAVACPPNLEQKAGTTYDCQITSDAGTFLVTVEPTGQPGQFKWGTKGLLLLSKLDSFLQKNASANGGNVAVDCGGKIRPAKPGETFECKLTDSQGKTRTTKVTVRDDQGNVYIAPPL
jgi:Domain of unknown function (DUF4333)